MYTLVKSISNQFVQKSGVRYLPRSRKGALDPGIYLRKKFLMDNDEDLSSDFDYEQHEADFMEVNKSHSEHMSEIDRARAKEKLFIVKQKYFKEKYPNFLTWGEKEQIKYLHRHDPQEWTIERLSEGFPALPHIIKKIVNAHWTKRTENKIKNHDTNVNHNWESFKQGEFSHLPQKLVNHLRKFSNRPLTDMVTPTFHVEVAKPQMPNMNTEFKDIVSLSSKSTTDHRQKGEKHQLRKPPSKDTYLLPGAHGAGLKQFKVDPIAVPAESANLMLNSTEKSDEPKTASKVQAVNFDTHNKVDKFARSNVTSVKTTDMLVSPNKILIAPEIYKKGCTYKLNDCFYNDHGVFMYRVPGWYQ